MHRNFWFFCTLLLALITGACSSTSTTTASSKPAETLYMDGMQALKVGKFKVAIEQFQEIDQKHPFSPWATRAQINLIYAHFKQGDYDDAVSDANRFIRLHPRHRHASYAFYMRGLANYQRISDSYRDQSRTRETVTAFRELIARFPKSDYAWEAQQMLLLCVNRIAEQEMVVGRFYLDREEYIAAINRFTQVINNPEFQTTPYIEEALFSQVLASQRLGLTEEANNYAAVLGHNYPKSPFYQAALRLVKKGGDVSRGELAALRQGVDEGSVLSRFFQGLAPTLLPTQTEVR
ncbi:MAG: outer membrane protein assembly factor BamD [Magnetococcales bacterium]|nr:outer membrane protein assembly factor BamD [Magnetococcales bacterium]